MAVALVIVLVLCGGNIVPSSASSDCVQVSADKGARFPVFTDLSAALAVAVRLANSTLCLLPGKFPFAVAITAFIDSQLSIKGAGQVVQISKPLKVTGLLTIFNCTLTTDITSVEFSMITLAGGSVRIEDSSVEQSYAILVAGVGSGFLIRSNFSSNTAPAVSIEGDSEVQVLKCSVWNHSGEFVRVALKPHVLGFLSITIQGTAFRENSGSGYLILWEAPQLIGNLTIAESDFSFNLIPQLYLDLRKVAIRIDHCAFLGNNQTAVTVYAAGTTFTITDSLWRGNYQTVFEFRQFTGDLIVTRTTISDQRWKGVFQVHNVEPAEQCRLTFTDLRMLDTYFQITGKSPGALAAYGCLVEIARSTFKNMVMATVMQRDIEGLVVVRIGQLAISEMELYSSGTTGSGLVIGMGNFRLTDSLLYDIRSGGNLYVGVAVGSLMVENVTVTHAIGFPVNETDIGIIPLYFFAMDSALQIHSVQVVPGPGTYDNANILFGYFSVLNISDFVVRDFDLYTFGVFWAAEGQMSNVSILNCTLRHGLLYFFVYNSIRVSSMTIEDSNIGSNLRGLLRMSHSEQSEFRNITLTNVTSLFILTAFNTSTSFRNFVITDSHFGYLVHYPVDSSVYWEHLEMQRCTGGLAYLYRSSISLIDSVLVGIEASAHFIGGERANVMLQRVTIRDLYSHLSLSNMKESSQLLINQSSFSNYHSLSDIGFYIHTGSVSILNTKFFSFNVALIQATDCTVQIHSSKFQEGSNNILSRKSDSAFGGVLGCVDCPSVEVESSSFLNVSTAFGGAVAVRSSSGRVRIAGSEFVGCKAAAGGAVYAQQASVLIESSQFVGNRAEGAGGAVDISAVRAEVRSCLFVRNEATDGGAVKWRRAEAAFVNVTFQENSAVYGPNVASFGVRLHGYVAARNGTQASSYPLQLIFELQDHYGQRVTTASTQQLQLVSNSWVNYRGNQAATISEGLFNFSELTIYAQPKSQQQVLGVMSYIENGQMLTLNGSIGVDFRDCVPGEVRKTDRCEYCFPGNVSFNPSDAYCRFCPAHAVCPGGSVLLVSFHYWRSSNESLSIIECPLKRSCLGGEGSECAEGYTGKVCSQCASHYSRIRTLECAHCSTRFAQWMSVLLTVIPAIGFWAATRSACDINLFILKSAISHAQFLSALSYLRVSFSTAIKYGLHSISYVSSLFVSELPLSCFFGGAAEYTRAVMGSLAPSAVLVLLLLGRGQVKDRLIACTGSLLFTPMIPLYTHMPLLACTAVGSPHKSLLLEMEQQCWQGTHLLVVTALVVPSLVLNVLVPVALVAVVATVAPSKFDAYFPLWRSGVNWRCWDLLQFSSKGALISLLSVSMVSEELVQVTYGLLVLIIASIVTAGAGNSAFPHWKLFLLAESSLVIAAVSVGLSAYFAYSSVPDGAMDWTVSALFLGVNAGYFLLCVGMCRRRLSPLGSPSQGSVIDPCESVGPPPNSIEIDYFGSNVDAR